jgi:drug/metabolite transporter (DMT)-like permease
LLIALPVWGFYYSLRYLPLSEATVINFLSPMVAAFASSLISRVPFTIPQQIASAVSILGVILVSQPWHMLTEIPRETPPAMSKVINGSFAFCKNCHGIIHTPENPSSIPITSSRERIAAVGASLIGVAGGAAAYVVLSLIGQEAHPAVTVNHFAMWTVLMTALGFAVTGMEAWRMPSPSECGLLMFLGVAGLLLQLLIATSLQSGGSTKALNMVYTQIVFALVMDELVWGQHPNWVSVAGGTLILGSVVTAAVIKGRREDDVVQRHGLRDVVCDEEEVEMMIGKDPQCSTDDEE